MNIPGLLIEYIINGAIAFVWIIMIMFNFPELRVVLSQNSGIVTLLAIPSAYVMGMLIDNIAHALVYKAKNDIKLKEFERVDAEEIYFEMDKAELGKLGSERSLSDKLIIDLNLMNKEGLADEIKWRSSRDRIARGFIVNVFLIGLATTLNLCLQFYQGDGAAVSSMWVGISIGLIMSIGLAYVFMKLWRRFEMMSFRFQLLTYIKVIHYSRRTKD